MDWRDEDSDINTGYWKGDGVSRTFGGVYRLISVTNSFSNGEYTCDINAQRVVPYDDPKDPNAWVAPLTNDPFAADAPDFTDGATNKKWHDGMEGSTTPQGYYTDYQFKYYQDHGELPPTTEDPDG
jgi:hypothetical protein